MPFFYTTPPQIALGTLTANAWNLNIASGAPAGSSGVAVLLTVPTNTGADFTLRMAGVTTPDTQHSTSGSTPMQKCLFTGVNASAQFDLYVYGSVTGVKAYLLGYFGSEAVFFPNALALAALGTSATTYSTNQYVTDAVAVFVDVFNVYQLTLRQTGSTDVWAPSTTSHGQLIGVDVNETFQGYAGIAGPVPYLRGYMQNGITWHKNAVLLGAPAAGADTNLTTPGIGGIYKIGAGIGNFTICNQNCLLAQFNPQLPPYTQVNTLASVPAVVIPTNAVNLFELGYFGQGGTGAALYASPGISGPF